MYNFSHKMLHNGILILAAYVRRLSESLITLYFPMSEILWAKIFVALHCIDTFSKSYILQSECIRSIHLKLKILGIEEKGLVYCDANSYCFLQTSPRKIDFTKIPGSEN